MVNNNNLENILESRKIHQHKADVWHYNHQKYSIANTHTWSVLLKLNKQILVRHFVIS